MPKQQVFTFARGVLVRLQGPSGPMNVTISHAVGECTAQDNGAVRIRATEVAWDKDNPIFYKCHEFGGPIEVVVKVSNVLSHQILKGAGQ